MHATGIIAEYNPFHNGHQYQINWVKEHFPATTLVIAMSGNYLQRGEPACFDKWVRAREALQAGADLVVEIPFGLCMQPADRFAQSGVAVLQQLGVENLVFGAEHSNYDFKDLAQKSQDLTWDYQRYNISYAALYQQAVKEAVGFEITQPNDLLGLAYARAALALAPTLNLVPIQRQAAGYHDQKLPTGGHIASATAIRQNIHEPDMVKKFVGAQTWMDIKQETSVTWANLWPLLRYRLLTATPEQLATIYGMAEGIQYRMQEQLQLAPVSLDFDTWLKKVKTKRFTYTRLSRLALATVLNISAAEVEQAWAHPFVRILGFNRTGQNYLSTQKKKIAWPVVTNVNKELKKTLLSLDYRVGKVYQMFNHQEQDMRRAPIRIGV